MGRPNLALGMIICLCLYCRTDRACCALRKLFGLFFRTLSSFSCVWVDSELIFPSEEASLVTTPTLAVTASALLVEILRLGRVRGCFGVLDAAYDERCRCFRASRRREQPHLRFEDAFGLASGCRQVVHPAYTRCQCIGRFIFGGIIFPGDMKGVV